MQIIGSLCKYGHNEGRYKSGACIVCSRERSRKQREEPDYREKKKQYVLNYLQKPENRAADRERHVKWRKTANGKKTILGYHLQAQYGISIGQFESMVATQNNLCAICRKDGRFERTGRLSVDHDHKSNQIRQLLCDDCNVVIGRFGEDPERLEAAAMYLRKHSRR